MVMKFTKTVEVPATTKEVVVHYQCDLCGKISEDEDCWPSNKRDETSSRWRLGVPYNYRETTIEMNLGDRYPGSGSGTVTKYDICTDCFRDKLIPWFEAQGALPRKSDWEW